ncbi:MAG: Maf-like protein [Spirochaetales bacterium]|nr:Maf-like protein [Spirochaetales bacterium]
MNKDLTPPTPAEGVLYLASGSPQRKLLLDQMGVNYKAFPQDIDETFVAHSPEEEAKRLAKGKVESLLRVYPGVWALGADTFVTIKTISHSKKPGTTSFPGFHLIYPRLLGKPKDRKDAESILTLLSGRTQTVVTGLALALPDGKIVTKVVKTRVKFSKLSTSDIRWYLDTGEWEDAAGAYRIQNKGACLADTIKGSYSNVVGLPIKALYGILHSNNYPMY